MSTIIGFFERNSVTLQIDDELITYTGVSKKPPYAFTGCKRGACGTRVAAHAKGAKAHHLRQCFYLFVADGDSKLFTEVAHGLADLANEVGFDMMYLDAPGRRRHRGRPGRVLVLRVEVPVRPVQASEASGPVGGEHVSAPLVGRTLAHRRLGPPHTQPQEVHRHPLPRQRTRTRDVPAYATGLVVLQDVAGVARRTHLSRRHRVPVRQGPGPQQRPVASGRQPEQPGRYPRLAAAGGRHPTLRTPATGPTTLPTRSGKS